MACRSDSDWLDLGWTPKNTIDQEPSETLHNHLPSQLSPVPEELVFLQQN